MPDDNQRSIDRNLQGVFVSSFVKQLKFKRKTYSTIENPGGFTSLINMDRFAIAANTDGIGTKVIIAAEDNKWDTLGIDCIAMNVNDIITVGAEPIAMLTYIALKEPNTRIANQLGIGFNVGAEMANISIVGGETSIMPSIMNSIDISGSAIGIVQKSKIINGKDIKSGDLIFALQSSGIHSNGFTTVREIMKNNELTLNDNFPHESKKVSAVLLEPTRIYVKEIMDLMDIVDIKGMANITGAELEIYQE